ncbi:MAG: fumarylacetoacetate hydrolase family protein [Planctomycetota bacterium]|nr:fumarylacetoacetate hydrolase family protein [Planctomycetota bacterium]
MKFVRYGRPEQEKPGVIDNNGNIRSLTGIIDDLMGATLSDESIAKLSKLDIETLPIVNGPERLGPCVNGTGKIICIGLNYADHARESGIEIPKEPIVFMKATSSIIGPNDDVEIPRNCAKTDWEVELGVVIGKTARYVSESLALDYVAGYCVTNDLSERAWQFERGGQWTKGKSFDTFAPIGPWLVTRDEIKDPQDLRLWLEVDGHRYQDGSTKTMIFSVSFLISYLSQFMTLHPGDVISTGTPPGVGFGQKPPVYLRSGQTIRLGVEGLGEQAQRTVTAR